MYRYSGYWAGGYYNDASWNSGWTESTGNDKIVLNANYYSKMGNATGYTGNFQIELPNATNTSAYKLFRASESVIFTHYPMWQSPYFYAGYLNSNDFRDNALDYFSFFASSGNITSADYRVFGKI